MNWEELTGDAFPAAVERAGGVCLAPLSVIERHGHHLPLGTDMYIGREICRRAAAMEPALIFPDVIFTQILEARQCAGTIAIDAELIMPLLDNICREIARNGLSKIILVNAHGGNLALLRYFTQAQLERPRDYTIYVVNPWMPAPDEPADDIPWQTTVDGHAGERETSEILAIRPDLVNTESLHGDDEGLPLGRLRELNAAGVQTGIWWYADHPTHYRGDGRPATAENGDRFLARCAERLVRAIRLVKADEETARLQAEFFRMAEHPRF
jgi:creatinine amidohydrolase